MGYPRRRLDSDLDGNIQYPAEFVERLKKEFPEWDFIIQAAKEGKVCVAWLLQNRAESHPITPQEILHETSLTKLKDRAREIQLCYELAVEARQIFKK